MSMIIAFYENVGPPVPSHVDEAVIAFYENVGEVLILGGAATLITFRR